MTFLLQLPEWYSEGLFWLAVILFSAAGLSGLVNFVLVVVRPWLRHRQIRKRRG